MNRWKNPIIITVITIIAFIALAAYLVQSVESLQIEIEAHFIVTSRDTALWDPGYHEFDMEGDGHVKSPINQVFSISGNGSVDYHMLGPNPWPPGPLEATFNFSGNIDDSTWGGLGLNAIGGPININVWELSTETMEVMMANPEYIRTEVVFDLWMRAYLEALWDPSPFNVTDGNFTVNFRQIANGGKYFEIDVNGTATVFPAGEPEPIPEMAMILSLTMIAPVLIYKIRQDL